MMHLRRWCNARYLHRRVLYSASILLSSLSLKVNNQNFRVIV